MLDSLQRCHLRGIALQQRADESDLRARFIFIPQEDAEAFARWADKLAMAAHGAAAVIRFGDSVRRIADRFARREVSAPSSEPGYRTNLGAARKAMDSLDPAFEGLPVFESASGDDVLSRVLHDMVGDLLESGKETLGDTGALMAATSEPDMAAVDRLRQTLAARSHLGYAGDNVYLLIRNITRSNGQVEYHANEAAKHINWLNIGLANAVLLLPADALAAKMPELAAAARNNIRHARRWIASGRALLADRLAEASKTGEAPAARNRIGALRTLGELLDEEAALADRFDTLLGEVESALEAGGKLPDALVARLVHGGESTGAALLQRRIRLRFELGAAG